MSTSKALVAFFNETQENSLTAIIRLNENGHPTGQLGVCEVLVDVVSRSIDEHRVYSASRAAADSTVAFMINGDYDAEIMRETVVTDDIRFVYCVVPDRVLVYDARLITPGATVGELLWTDKAFMFETYWVDDERRREIKRELLGIDARVVRLENELASIDRRRPSTR